MFGEPMREYSVWANQMCEGSGSHYGWPAQEDKKRKNHEIGK